MLIYNNSTQTVAEALRDAAKKHGDFSGTIYSVNYCKGPLTEAWDELTAALGIVAAQDIKKYVRIVLPVNGTSIGPTGSGAGVENTDLLSAITILHPVRQEINGVQSELTREVIVGQTGSSRTYSISDSTFYFPPVPIERTIIIGIVKALVQPLPEDRIGITGGYRYLVNRVASIISDGTVSEVAKRCDIQAAKALNNIITLALKGEGPIDPGQFSEDPYADEYAGPIIFG